MLTGKRFHALFTLILLLLGQGSQEALAQGKRKGKKVVPTGRPVLWKNPGNLGSRDLFLGPGGAEMRPDTTRLTFIKEETGGYSPKVRVRDGRGREWVAKLGKEAQSETASVRLL